MQQNEAGTGGGGDEGSSHQQWRQRLRSRGQHNLHGRRRMRSRHGENQLRRRIILMNIMVFVVFLCAIGLVVHITNHPLSHSMSSFRLSRKTSSLMKQIPSQPAPPRKSQEKRTVYDFVCKNHPDKRGVLNDDYCDCPDGSDETNTSACSHLLVGKQVYSCDQSVAKRNFSNGGFGVDEGLMIFASRVRDGVVDCPHGTDEKWNVPISWRLFQCSNQNS